MTVKLNGPTRCIAPPGVQPKLRNLGRSHRRQSYAYNPAQTTVASNARNTPASAQRTRFHWGLGSPRRRPFRSTVQMMLSALGPANRGLEDPFRETGTQLLGKR